MPPSKEISPGVRTLVSAVPRCAVGALLLIAGLAKVGGSADLASSMENLGLPPHPGVQLAALILPVWEISVGLLMILRLCEWPAAAFSCLLFGSFVAATAWTWLRGQLWDCGCFGSKGPTLSPLGHLLVGGLGLLLSLLAAGIASRSRRVEVVHTSP